MTTGVSFWWDSLGGPGPRRPALSGRVSADVAIVGAGLTGLWSAYYLLGADPSLRVVLLEAEHVGFGASGRNGGWCSALFPVSLATLAREHGRDPAIAQYRAMIDTVAEVGSVVEGEGIDCGWAHGGTVVVARSAPQLLHAEAAVEEFASFGFRPDDVTMLDADAASQRLAASGVTGGTYTPHCAAVNPVGLLRGVAAAVESRGATVYENSRAELIEPGRVRTTGGAEVHADVVLRATEGYTAQLAGLRRQLAPVYSLVVATAPLPAATWDRIGLAHRETFSDFRHLIVYGQRTADDRLVFGGRGAPYHLGSRIDPGYDRVPAVFDRLRRTLVELFPVLGDVEITHTWGGPLGIARDWHPSVSFDPATGVGWAGGYVGDGLSTTNLAGRTLRDLVRGEDTQLTRLPWVGHQSPKWEPEPLRWLGANAGLRAMQWADAAEARGTRPSRAAAVVDRLLGR